MGYFISKLKDRKLNEYIGSQTMNLCADNGAFDCDVDEELDIYANDIGNVFAIVDKNGVGHFLKRLKSGQCHGRDIQKFIDIVEMNYLDGFMIHC